MSFFILGILKSPLNALCFSSFFAKIWAWSNPSSSSIFIDPNCISVLHDSWFFEIPINFKSTFFNVDYVNSNFQVSDFLIDGNWNFEALHDLFGSNFNSPIGKLARWILILLTLGSGYQILVKPLWSLQFIILLILVMMLMISGKVRAIFGG